MRQGQGLSVKGLQPLVVESLPKGMAHYLASVFCMFNFITEIAILLIVLLIFFFHLPPTPTPTPL